MSRPHPHPQAKEPLDYALGKEPNNRAVREALVDVKKAIAAEQRLSERALFAKVDLGKKGLTSQAEVKAKEMEEV